jgi:D-3-phosphoglycerate dehydrogenase
VLIADKFEASGIEALTKAGFEVVSDPSLTPDTLGAALAEKRPAALVVRSTKVPAGAIEKGAASGLRLIVRAGAGYDNIDLTSASTHGVAVCNCPGMNAVAVAELAIGHLIALDRRIPEQHAALQAGKWNKKEFGKARGLKGRTLGIVGLGAIGGEVAKRAKAFDMNVVAWSRHLDEPHARILSIEFGGDTREELLRMVSRCDAISVHVAQTPETIGMCDAEFFGAMKQGAYFVNTSRGKIVKEAALADAVKTRGIRAAIDVYENQPGEPEAAFDCPMSKIENVHCTHHCGASTDQAQQAVADETVRILTVFRDTGRTEHCVNADALASAAR